MAEKTFLYTHAELELLGTPGFDRDRDEADEYNARVIADLAVQSETTFVPVSEE